MGSGVATWTVGDLAPLATYAVDITFTAGTTTGTATNTQIVTGGGDSDTDTATVEIVEPDISATKVRTSADNTVAPGADVAFTLTLTNNADVTAAAASIVDTWDPSMLTYVSADPAATSMGSGVATWTVGDLAPLATYAVDITFTAGTTTGTATNTQIVTGGGDSDTDTATVEIVEPDISATKVRTSADNTVAPGADVAFTLTLTNNADVTAAAASIVDTWDPSMLTYVSADPAATSMGSGVATWTVGDLAPLATYAVDITFTAGTTTGTATNTQIVTAAATATRIRRPSR